MDLEAVGLELDLGNVLTILLTEKNNNNNQIKMFQGIPRGHLTGFSGILCLLTLTFRY